MSLVMCSKHGAVRDEAGKWTDVEGGEAIYRILKVAVPNMVVDRPCNTCVKELGRNVPTPLFPYKTLEGGDDSISPNA